MTVSAGIDFAAAPIRRWIQPQHLDPAALADLARQFSERPERYVAVNDFLAVDRLAQIRAALLEDGEVETAYKLFGDEEPTTKERFEAAAESRRFICENRYVGPRRGREMAPSVLQEALFRMEMRGAGYRAWLSAIAGETIGATETIILNKMAPGHMLGWHNDAINQRKLCAVLYLHEDWRPEYGGRLLMRRRDGGLDAIEPLCNRLVVFAPTVESVHRVEPIDPAVGDWLRLNYTAWFC